MCPSFSAVSSIIIAHFPHLLSSHISGSSNSPLAVQFNPLSLIHINPFCSFLLSPERVRGFDPALALCQLKHVNDAYLALDLAIPLRSGIDSEAIKPNVSLAD